MAQGRLVPLAAGGAVLLGGAAVEVLTGPTWGAAADWLVGAAFVAAALRGSGARGPGRTGSGRNRSGRKVAGRNGSAVWLGLATAALWYLATLAAEPASPSGWAQVLRSVTVLSYRGPLLHWLARAVTAGRDRVMICMLAVGYLGCLTGLRGSALATAAVAVAIAGHLTRTARRRWYPEDLRRSTLRVSGLLAVLALVWGIAASGLLRGTASQLVTAGCLVAVAWHLSRPAGAAELSGAVGSLVLELGPSNRSASPIWASLARALADPDLQVRTYQPGIGWTDELGQTVDDPVHDAAGRGMTDAPAPGGGRIVLLHGPRGSAGSELARAAAGAAGLALESVRVEALARQEAADVRRSAARLVTVNEVERNALAGRLRAGAIARLELLRNAMHQNGSRPTESGERADRSDPVQPVIEELDRVIEDLDRLAHGLNPGTVRAGSLRQALTELVRGCGMAVALELTGDVDGLGDDDTALAYFVVAECLTNVVRHARAFRAQVHVQVGRALVIEIVDDGRGGATVQSGRGLQGLADRVAVADGRFDVSSPEGGPTSIRVEVPHRRGTTPPPPQRGSITVHRSGPTDASR